MALNDSLDPYGASLNAGLTDAAGRTIDIASPTWYEDFNLAKRARQEAASPQVQAAVQPETGPYLVGADPADPNHPTNYFDPEYLKRFTADERRERHSEWMKLYANKFMTPQGLLDFKASASAKENNIFGIVQKNSAVANVKDVGLSFAQGAVGAVESIANLAGADNVVSKALNSASESLETFRSKESKINKQAGSIATGEATQRLSVEVERRLASGESSSTVGAWLNALKDNKNGELRAYLKAALEDPADTIAQAAGSLITAGVGKTAQAIGLGRKAIIGTNIATGAAQGLGEVKGGIYDQVKRQAEAAGKTPSEAEAIAVQAQAYSAENVPRFLASAGLGGLAGAVGVQAVLTGTAKKVVGQGAVKTIAKGVGAESLTELTQDAQGTEAANNASINAALMKESERFSGVAGKAAVAGVVGGILGGGVSAVGASSSSSSSSQPPAAGATSSTPAAKTTPTAAGPGVTPTNASVTTVQETARAALVTEMQQAVKSGDENLEAAVFQKAEDTGLFTQDQLDEFSRGNFSFTQTIPEVTTAEVVQPDGTTATVPTASVSPTGEIDPTAPATPTVAGTEVEQREAPPATMSELVGRLVDYGGIVGTLVTDGNTGGFRVIGPRADDVVRGSGAITNPSLLGVAIPTQKQYQAYRAEVEAAIDQGRSISKPEPSASDLESTQATVAPAQPAILQTITPNTNLSVDPSAAVKPLISKAPSGATTVLNSATGQYLQGTVLARLAQDTKGINPTQVKLLKTLTPFLNDVRVESVSPDHRLLNSQGVPAAAAYDPTGRVIYIANDIPTSVATATHEMVHAAVDRVMHREPALLSKRQLAARHIVEDMYAFVQNQVELEGQYGMENVHEFVAEAMSNPAFQEKLSHIKVPEGNFLNRFFAAVKTLLGFDAVGKSVLDVVYESTPFMFDAPSVRYGEMLNKVKSDAPMYDKYSKYNNRPKTEKAAISRRLGEWITEKFSDHGVKGENQILDEIFAETSSPELKAAMTNVRQQITLRDMSGTSTRLAEKTVAPVEEDIRRLAQAAGMEANDLRHEAGTLAVAQHSLDTSERQQSKLTKRVGESQAMLDAYDAAQVVLAENRQDIATVTGKIDRFYDRATMENYLGHSQTIRNRLVGEMSKVIEKLSAKLDTLGRKATPEGRAASLIKRAWAERNYEARNSGDSRRIIEAAKQFSVDVNAMLGPRDAVLHMHNARKELLQNWQAAQTNDRVEAADGSGRMVTFGEVKLPGGFRMSEAQEIVDSVSKSGNSQQIQEAAQSLRGGFVALTEEAVAAGVMTRPQADAFYTEDPLYVNTQGKSDAEKDDSFLEKNFKGYLATAEGSYHLNNSNDVFSNLTIRNDKLASVIANQKVGQSMVEAINAGTKLFEYGIPFSQNKDNPNAKTFVRVQVGNNARYITPSTDEGQKMLGVHPNTRTPEALKAFAPVTRLAGRAVTHFNPVFGPINLMRDVPTRLFNLVGRRTDLVKADGKPVSLTVARASFLAQAFNPFTWAEAIAFSVTKTETGALISFKETGGLQTFADRLKTEEQVEALFKKKWQTGIVGAATAPLKALAEFATRWNNIFETVTVLSSYKGLTAAGLSSQQAGYVTLSQMNFRKAGDVTASIISPLYVFANATAQDLTQFKRSFYYRGKTNWRAIAEVSALAAAGAMLYSMARDDDEDDGLGGKKMDALPEGTLYKTLVIPQGNGEYLKIPIGFGAIQSAYQMGVAYQRFEAGLISNEDFMADSFAAIVKNASLTGGSETPFLKDPLNWVLQTFSPTLARPLVQSASGKNFAGGEITAQIRRDKFASEQGKWRTPEKYKEWATNTRELIGVDSAPETVRNLAEGYMMGPLAAVLDWMVDVQGDKLAKGADPESAISGTWRALGINRIMAKTDDGKVVQHAFYKELEKTDELKKKFEFAAPKDKSLKRETAADKLERYASAGMSPQEGQKLELRTAFDKEIKPLKDEGKVLQGRYMKGEDVSVEMQDVARREAEMMTEFVKKVRGIQ